MIKTKTKTKKTQPSSYISTLHISVLAFILAVVPLIVLLKIIPLEGVLYEIWTGDKNNFDFFSYYKSRAIVWAAIILVLSVIFGKTVNKLNFKKTNIYIPIGIFSVLAILSTILSKNKKVAMHGFIDRYEGLFVLIAYMMILVIAINVVNKEKHIKVLMGAVLASGFIICVVGLFQFWGLDIFKTRFGIDLILPSSLKDLADQLKFTLEDSLVYSTLYHSNYVGSYIAMLLPICIALFLLLQNKTHKIVMASLSVLMIVNLLGSRSRGGLVGLGLAIIILVIILWKRIFKNKAYLVSFMALSSVCLLIMNSATDDALLNKIVSITSDPRIIINEGSLKDVVINGNEVEITFGNEVLRVKNQDGNLLFKDSNGDDIPIENINGILMFQKEGYKNYSLHLSTYVEGIVLQVQRKDISLRFLIDDNGFKFINKRGEPVNLRPIERIGFEGRENLGSARGYIWSRSLPLLKKTWLIGFGPDTFAIHFPQDDYIGKLIAYGDMGMVVDKAHNLYLQTAINTGVLSLLAMLSLFGMYMFSSLKLYIKNQFNDTHSIVGVAIFLGICGYLAAGLFNDSVVSVAPVFWGLLGIGISINIHLTNLNMKKH